MSELKLNLLDSHTTIIATVHGSVGDALVAALSAEPETIDELESAFTRFQKCTSIPASSLYRSERCEIDETPYDAGILVIDLAARIVSCESTYSLPGPRGTVDYHDGTHGTGFPLKYQLSDDWMFLRSIEDYQILCQERVKERARSAGFDVRAVLYGEPLLKFILDSTQESHDEVGEEDLQAQMVVEIHRRWLMTQREDLNGLSPREILLAKQDLIDFDLDSRMLQWSYFLEQPTPLSSDSNAYRYAGFGTHEWVMYYELVRFLIWAAIDEARTYSTLDKLKFQWLSEPRDDLDGYIPSQVIHNERRRLPEAMSGRSMVIDENCFCCKMMGDESEAGLGIYFCHFDSSDMEDEFAFSCSATVDEWEKERAKFAGTKHER